MALENISPALAAASLRSQALQGQPPQGPALHNPVLLTTALQVSRLLLHPDGPVVEGTLPYYADRNNTNTKWYLPEFHLLPPDKGFLFTCSKNGVYKDEAGRLKDAYTGKIRLPFVKQQPAAISTAPGVVFKEIPLSQLQLRLSITFTGQPSDTFNAPLTPTSDGSFLAELSIPQMVGLSNLYQVFARSDYMRYCTIEIRGSYAGYLPPPTPPILQNWHPILVKPVPQTPPHPVNPLPRPIRPFVTIATHPVTTVAARPVVSHPITPQPPARSPYDQYKLSSAIPFSSGIVYKDYAACTAYPGNYVEYMDAASTVVRPFGCQPPFDASQTAHRYSEYTPLESLTPLGVNSIYLNVVNGNFLVIPSSYYLAWDETDDNQLVPSCYLFTKVDAGNVSSSTATLKCNLAPNISEARLLHIKRQLLASLTATGAARTISDIVVEFPTTVDPAARTDFGSKVPVVQLTGNEAYRLGVTNSYSFHLELQDVNIGNADLAALIAQLKGHDSFLSASLRFSVDCGTDPSPVSTIQLSLERVIGNGLTAMSNKDKHLLFNKTIYDAQVSAFLTATGPDQPLQPFLVKAEQAWSDQLPDFDQASGPFAFEYTYQLNPVYADNLLPELRTDVAQVSDNVIVTTNAGLFSLFGIDHIDFEFQVLDPRATDANPVTSSVSLKIDQDGKYFQLPFVLSASQYYSNRLASYYTIVSYRDRTETTTSDPRQPFDLNSVGKLINLTPTNMHLSLPANG